MVAKLKRLINERVFRQRNLLEEVRRDHPDTWGYIYVIESTSGHFKIGRSRDPQKRFRELVKTQGPFEYYLVNAILTDDMYAFEKEAHDHFSEHRVSGEWFTVSAKELDWLLDALYYFVY